LAQSRQNYDETKLLHHLTTIGPFNNPTRRDVAIVPNGGFLLIAFKNDNPGSWILHCHIAFHASAGLAVEIITNPYKNDTRSTDGSATLLFDVEQQRRTCHSFRKWVAHQPKYEQIDNGL